MNLPAYRDPLEGARIRYTEILAGRSGQGGVAATCAVAAARAGRIWAGAAGIACAVVLAGAAVASAFVGWVRLTPILLAAWPVMIAAYAIGALGIGGRMRRAAAPPPTGDVQADLARIEAARPVAFFRERAHALERRSMALPMIAVALLAPLTIHFLVAMLVGVSLRSFDTWICLSLVIVGHAHLYLAYRCHALARDAGLLDGEALAAAVRERVSGALLWVIAVSAVPGAVLFLLPPVITALTGALVIPVLFRWTTRTVLAERAALA